MVQKGYEDRGQRFYQKTDLGSVYFAPHQIISGIPLLKIIYAAFLVWVFSLSFALLESLFDNHRL